MNDIQLEIKEHAAEIQKAILEAQQHPSYKLMTLAAQVNFIHSTICIHLCRFANKVIDLTVKI